MTLRDFRNAVILSPAQDLREDASFVLQSKWHEAGHPGAVVGHHAGDKLGRACQFRYLLLLLGSCWFFPSFWSIQYYTEVGLKCPRRSGFPSSISRRRPDKRKCRRHNEQSLRGIAACIGPFGRRESPMRSSPMIMVFGLATLALALYVLPAALASDAGNQRTRPGWSAPFMWLTSCRPPDTFECQPEPEYFEPDPVCPACLCRSDAESSAAGSEAAPASYIEASEHQQPELVGSDPQQNCPEDCPLRCANTGGPLK
jgi:hypothetical protein